jgi:hypothetical protein
MLKFQPRETILRLRVEKRREQDSRRQLSGKKAERNTKAGKQKAGS